MNIKNIKNIKNNFDSIRELLLHYLGEPKPKIRPYDSETPDDFWRDLDVLEKWHLSQAARFFQVVLGLVADGDSAEQGKKKIAAETYKKFAEFLRKNDPDVEVDKILKQDTIHDYLLGGHQHNGENTHWDRENLFLVCMALEICEDDPQNARRLFNLLGVPYARFADPKDIVYAWAVEKCYAYRRFIDLMEKVKPYCIDLESEYFRSIKALEKADKNVDKTENTDKILDYLNTLKDNDPLDYDVTSYMEEKFRAIWDYDDENLLLECFEEFKKNFHHCSITRAAIIEALCGDDARTEYISMMEGRTLVGRKDIVRLCCEKGKTISEIDLLLKRAGFAQINPDYRFIKRTLCERLPLTNAEARRLSTYAMGASDPRL